MIPSQCVRPREAISLQLDDMLSSFEAVRLDRHLRSCPSCRAFAASASAQTLLLRSAVLERPPRSVVIPARPSRARRVVANAIRPAAAATAAAAALLILAYPVMTQRGERHPARAAAAPDATVLVTYVGHPTPNPAIQVPRLRVVPATFADGPVHGLFSVPVVDL